MEIKKMDGSMVNSIVYLWNSEVYRKQVYAEWTNEEFKNRIINNPHFDPDGFLVAIEDGDVIGFGHAIYNNQDKDPALTPGYITCIVVKTGYQRRGIGTKILKALEEFLKSKGKTFVRNYFANPVSLKWYIPGTDKHEHNGAPAVPFNSPFYLLLSANGYIVNGQQDGYHIDLTKYELDESIKKRIEENEKDGYHITVYDPNKHYGFDELFDALNNDGWRNSIKYNLNRENPRPIVIVEKDGEILGFTGPIYKEESGRASLSGVGIHPKTQGRGLGKTMFCSFCEESKKNGATFMTLFTGSDNKARNIYLYAGMKIAQSFAIMRKELK